MFSLKDQVAIVTGGTRGIGFETAKHLAKLGMHVVIGRLLSNHTPSARLHAPCLPFLIHLCSQALVCTLFV